MKHSIWRRWISRLFLQRRRFTKRLRDRRQLTFETLEDRLVPATDTWIGMGTGVKAQDWSNASNWLNGQVPVANDSIVFSSTTAPIKNTIDDISLASGGFNSISFSAPGYSVATAGTTRLLVTGPINASPNLGVLVSATSGAAITGNLEFAPPATSPQQTITVGSSTTLDISGTVSGNSAAQTVFKAGVGELELDGNNSAYTGSWNLSSNGGILLITNSNALGAAGGTTTVNLNAQLQVKQTAAGAGVTVAEKLILSGQGGSSNGAILNVAGNNTWTGTVQLDTTPIYFGSTTGNLTFTNVISDFGVQATVTKVGYGQISFAAADTYRGQTIVNNGILAIENPLALGAGATYGDTQSDTIASETIVNYNSQSQTFGTLEIDYNPSVAPIAASNPNAILQNNQVVGFQVFNDLLVLNGPGDDPNAPAAAGDGPGSGGLGNTQDYLGSLYNGGGNNGWDGNVSLGSNTSSSTDPVTTFLIPGLIVPVPVERNDVFIGAAANSNLTISGVVSSPFTVATALTPTPLLSKVQQGRVILANDNTYTGGTEVDQGELQITDSNALGTGNVWVGDTYKWYGTPSASGNSAWPANDASLELAVDSGLDGTATRTNNRNLGFDSVTGSGQGLTGAGTGSGQEIYIPGASLATSGSTLQFKLTFEGYSTPYLLYDVPAATLAADLNALTSVKNTVGSVTVTQDGNVYRVIFGTSTSPNVPLMTIATTGTAIPTQGDSGTAQVTPIYGLEIEATAADATNFIDLAGTGVNNEGALNSLSGINVIGNPLIAGSGAITIGNPLNTELDIGIPGAAAAAQPIVVAANPPALTPADNSNFMNPKETTGSIGSNLDSRPDHTTADNSYSVYDYKLTIPNANQITNGVTFEKEGAGQLVIAQSQAKTITGPTVIAAGWITVEANSALGPTVVNQALSALLQPDTITVDAGASLQLDPPAGSSITLGNNLFLAGLGLPATSLTTPGINFNMLTEGAVLSLAGDNILTGIIQFDGTVGIGVDDPILSDLPDLSTLTITGEMEDNGGNGVNPGGIEKLGTRELILEGPGTYTGSNVVESGTLLLESNTGLGFSSSGTVLNPVSNAENDTFSTSTTSVSTGGLLELGYNDPTTNGGEASSVSVWNEQLVLNGGGQQLNISGTGGTFTLTYTNPTTSASLTTAPIAYTSTAATMAAEIQSALNALANLSPFGSVVVTPAGLTGLFTVVFNGALASVANPLLKATNSVAPGNINVTVDGSPYSVYATADNLWNGGLTLNPAAGVAAPNSNIEVANNAQLTVTGTITGQSGAGFSLNTPANTSSTASADNGDLVLTGSNTYNGTTYVNAGILTVENSQALGGVGVSEVQAISFPVGAIGTFQLGFEVPGSGSTAGFYTTTLNVTDATLASDLQTALDNLLSIGGVGGSVQVVKSTTLPNTYNVTFEGGTLAGFQQPLLTVKTVSGTPGVSVTEGQQGYGGVVVSMGAQLQLDGNLTIAGKSLEVAGSGQSAANTPFAIPVTWQDIGPSPVDTSSGETFTSGEQAFSGRVTAVTTDPSDPNVIYIGTAGGGAWRTINDGLTWTPLFNGLPEIQQITVATTGPFTLTFNGATATIPGEAAEPLIPLVQQIQNALNGTSTSPGLSTVAGAGGSVVVTQAGDVYTITFGGAFNNLPEALMTTSLAGGVTEVQLGAGANVAMFVGAIAIDPNDVSIIYLGTGTYNSSTDAFFGTGASSFSNEGYYGTGVYQSVNYGSTWKLLTGNVYRYDDTGGGYGEYGTLYNDGAKQFAAEGANANPFFGDAITSIIVDPNEADTIYVSVADELFVEAPNVGIGPVHDPNTFNNTAGVWRWSSNPFCPDNGTALGGHAGWSDLTAIVSIARAKGAYEYYTPPGSTTGTTYSLPYTYEGLFNVIQNLNGLNASGQPALDKHGVLPPSKFGAPYSNAPPGVYLDYYDGGYVENPNTPSFAENLASMGAGFAIYPFSPPGSGSTTGSNNTGFPKAYAPSPYHPYGRDATYTAGPDDNWDISFPKNGVYSSMSWGTTSIPLLDLDEDANPYVKPGFYIDQSQQNALNDVPALFVAVGNPISGRFNALTRNPAGGYDYNYSDFPFALAGKYDYGEAENGVYRLINPFDATEKNTTGQGNGVSTVWDIGDGNVWSVTSGVPGTLTIKYDAGNPAGGPTTPGSFPIDHQFSPTQLIPDEGNIQVASSGYNEYAVVTWGADNLYTNPPYQPQLEYIFASTNGGQTWVQVGTGLPDYLGYSGDYDSTIVASQTNPDEVFVAGAAENGPTGGVNGSVWESIDGGATFTDISTDFNHNASFPYAHASTIDDQGNLIVGSDGGVWEFDTATLEWVDLNGDLGNLLVSDVATAPGNPRDVLASSQLSGIELYDSSVTGLNGPAWLLESAVGGGEVQFDPQNTEIAYSVQFGQNIVTGQSNYYLVESNDGGQTWTNGFAVGSENSPFQIDPLNPQRLVFESYGGLVESTNLNFSHNLNIPSVDPYDSGNSVGAIALAQYQGQFQADPAFPDVVDKGANSPVPGTIYATGWALNGTYGYEEEQAIFVTKDDGVTWAGIDPATGEADRTTGMTFSETSNIAGIAVDPLNENHIFAVVEDNTETGDNALYESFNAGQSWTDITAGSPNLPDVPFTSVAYNPNTQTVYLGTDIGVFSATFNATTQTWGAFNRFDNSLPETRITNLDLDLSSNTLTVSTYGSGVWQVNVTQQEANSGGLRVDAGTSVWTGPIRFTGPTTIQTDGIQDYPQGQAQLDVQGIISDSVYGADSALTKDGGGTLIFTADNAYGGPTTVADGVLVSNNYTAMGVSTTPFPGAATNPVTVDDGASLELTANLDEVPVTLIGNGISFNGHYQGALFNANGNNTFQGTITLSPSGTDGTVTIGAASSTTLDLTGEITGSATNGLIKEGTGTVELDDSPASNPNYYIANNNYVAPTYVYQGALQADVNSAFGSTSNVVEVLDGAQVQLNGAVSISNPLVLTGTGYSETGALRGVGGMNFWLGPITFEILPGFGPFTSPIGTVAIGADAGDTLTLGGVVANDLDDGVTPGGTNLPIGLLKVGAGILAVDAANTYTGMTEVSAGILELENANGLGDRAADYANLATVQEIDTVDSNPTASAMFTISFSGQSATKIPFGASAATVAADINGLFASAGVMATVTVVEETIDLANQDQPPGLAGTSNIYSITLGGANPTLDTAIQVSGLNGVTANSGIVSAGNVDVFVDSGAELALDNAAGMTVAATHKLTLNGDGPTAPDALVNPNGDGALFNYVGNNAWAGPIELQTDVQIGAAANTTLTLSGAATSDAPFYNATVASLEKIDPGTLIFSSTGSFSGVNPIQDNGDYTIVTAGTLQVDGKVGVVSGVYLNGGTLTGAGVVGSISEQPNGVGGVVEPGDSGGTGTLTSSGAVSPVAPLADVLSGDTLSVELGNAGTSTSNLLSLVDASINLAGATLTGAIETGVSVPVGTQYTILETDPGDSITGTFNYTGAPVAPSLPGATSATVVWINNEKFEVDYFTTQVVLVRQYANITKFTLTDSSSNPVYGSDEQFYATLVSESGAPPVTGSVNFTVTYNGVTIENNLPVAINPATGVATLDLATLLGQPMQGGIYQVSVSYNGDNSSGVQTYTIPTPPAPLTVTVSRASTSINVSTSPTSPVYGQTIQITAVVTSLAPGVIINGTLSPSANSVNFYDGATLLNTEPGVAVAYTLHNVTATNPTPYLTAVLSISSLQVGGHLITADFAGDTNYLAVDSSPALPLVVNKDATSTSVVSAPTSPTPVYGQTVTFTATVTASGPGSGAPTGTVSFERTLSNGTVVIIGTGTLSGVPGDDQAVFQATTAGQLPVGSYPVAAVYNGDGNFFTSSGSTPQTVNQASTTTATVTSSAQPAVYGQSITFTAVVAPFSPGSGVPTGTVTFTNATTHATLGSGTVQVVGGSEQATFTINSLAVGNTVIAASYGGDTNFKGSNTTTNLTQVVSASPTTTSVTSSAEPGGAVYGQAVTFTATVAASGGGAGTPTGTVTFYITESGNLVPLGVGSLGVVAGHDVATYTTTSPLPLLTGQTITAKYSGDSNFQVSTGTMTQDVYPAGSIVTVISSATAGAVYGQAVTFTAQVKAAPPAVGTPTGTVTFMEGSTVLDANVPLSGGVASYTTTLGQLPFGSDPITVTYGGDENFTGNSGSFTQTVGADPTTTVVSSSGPSIYGNPVTFTATVNSNSPGSGNPTGMVTFTTTVNGVQTPLGTGTLTPVPGSSTSSTASYTTTNSTQFPVGTNLTITATYGGTTDYSGSSGSTTQTVSKGLVNVGLSSTPANSVYGQQVTFTATITPTGGAIAPTGTVAFSLGGTVLSTQPISGGTATFYTTALPAGLNQTITATYNGDSNYQSATGTTLQSVSADASTTTLAVSSSTANVGQVISLTATVASVSPGSGTPTGTVSFVNETTNIVLGSSSLANGTTTFQTFFSAAGSDEIEAVYNGTSQYTTSSSSETPVTVSAVGTRASKVTLTSSLNPAEVGQSVTFTAVVKDAGSGTAKTPIGVVSFMYGSTLLGTMPLTTVKGVTSTTFTTSTLPVGSDSITAVYDGDSTFAQAKSAALTETVSAIPTRASTIGLVSSSTYNSVAGVYTSSYGQSLTFTATITDQGGSPSKTPTGTVTFYYELVGSSSQVELGTGTLSGAAGAAKATYSTSTLPVGDYTIIASYSGDTTFAVDPPVSIKQDVTSIATTTVLTSSTSNATSVHGQSVTFTATVTKSTGGAASGSVVFTDEATGAVLGTVTLNSKGVAIVTTTTLPTGSDQIVATYGGSGTNIAGSSDQLFQTVNLDPTTVSVAASTTTSNTSVTFTATVKATSPGSGTPTGTVTFIIGGVTMGTGTVNASGKATLTLASGLPAGTYSVVVDYSGDSNFDPSSQSTSITFSGGRGT